MSILTSCASSAPKRLPQGSAEGKPKVLIARDCEYLLQVVDPTELRKIDTRVMLAEDDSALQIANERIEAGRYCMQRQRERLAKGK
jgi:hypothetical protein